MTPLSVFSFLALTATATAQSFIQPPKDVEVVLSEKFPGASISYKQVNDLCETTKGVRSFSGYVSLPKDFLPDAGGWEDGVSGNFFFWYFEARNDPQNAPISIYLGGGPGYTSFDGSSVFPCYVNPDSNSTTLNENSWNKNVNMLYIDQPLGTGFSYTVLANGSFNALTETFTPVDSEADLPEFNVTTLQATMQVGGPKDFTNSTKSAARSLWRFAQVWFNEFPEKNTKNDEISIWAVSYGGLYAPLLTSYIVDQNKLIKDKKHEVSNATTLNMATVGVINAMVDVRSMALGFPIFALNNTYDLPAYSEEVYAAVVKNITDPEMGCYTLIDQCRDAVAKDDPESEGTDPKVNQACVGASEHCFLSMLGPFEALSPYGVFDITYNRPASFPTEYETALFNQPWVQAELGVPLNYTRGNSNVEAAFLKLTGDVVRYDLSYLGQLLDSGVNVAMVYGDRDYRCNWISAENASLHIPFDSATQFASAGYEPITTNSSYEGGLVRQYGNLSFSRVFQAGHSAGGYQPETMSVIFERAMFGRDVATGEAALAEVKDYSSEGKDDVSDVENELPEPIENVCYLLQPVLTCTEEQLEALRNGTAEIEGGVVVKPVGSRGERLGEGKQGGDGEGEGEGEGDSKDGDGKTSVGGKVTASLIVAVLPVILASLW
ncbi:hypothetical protein ACJ41O_009209 [Fusarium nematophilum]